MMMYMPVEPVAAQSFTVQLTTDKYKLDIQWNDRGGYFTLSLYDGITDALLAAGLPLLLGVDILSPYNLGIGAFLMVDTSGRGEEATIEDFGDRVRLCWFSEDELNGLT